MSDHFLLFCERNNVDEIVKSRKTPFFVIPAKAGIQFFQLVTEFLDSGFHRSDDFLRNHQCCFRQKWQNYSKMRHNKIRFNFF